MCPTSGTLRVRNYSVSRGTSLDEGSETESVCRLEQTLCTPDVVDAERDTPHEKSASPARRGRGSRPELGHPGRSGRPIRGARLSGQLWRRVGRPVPAEACHALVILDGEDRFGRYDVAVARRFCPHPELAPARELDVVVGVLERNDQKLVLIKISKAERQVSGKAGPIVRCGCSPALVPVADGAQSSSQRRSAYSHAEKRVPLCLRSC